MKLRVWLFCGAFGLYGTPAWAQDDGRVQERQKVQERLSEERAGLELLKSQKIGVLEVLEALEGLSRASSRRSQLLQRELETLRRRVELAQRQEKTVRDQMRMLGERVSPRLLAMYRLQRSRSTGLLLTSSDLTSLMWRSKALSAVLGKDLELLRELHRLAQFHGRTLLRLGRMQERMAQVLEDAKAEQALAAAERADLADALSLIQAESSHSQRVIKELEASERELARLIGQMGDVFGQSAFAALRGKLPFPVEGRLEVPFGKIVNPRFNTVTVQKGIDLRAALGTPVRAVAPGKVVYGGWIRGYGNVMILDHGGGFHSLMAHLADFTVPVGEQVERGKEIGAVGDTGSLKGAYLYFEIRHNGSAIDPAPWLSEKASFR